MAACFGLSKGLTTLKDFERYRDVPEAFAYLVYATIKFIICIAYLIVIIQKYSTKCRPFKLCFCRPLKQACSIFTCLLNALYSIVSALFGAPLGIVERSQEEYMRTTGYDQSSREDRTEDTRQVAQCCITVCINKDVNNNEGEQLNDSCGFRVPHELPNERQYRGGKRLYIRGKELGTNEVLILAAVLVPFIVTIITTFWDRYTLKQTISCSEDCEVYCFPLAIAPTTNRDLNISTDTPRINDCSIWMTSEISQNVTFRCFQCVNDFEGAVAALGALATIFKLTIRAGFSLLIVITDKIMNCCKNSKKNSHERSKCCYKGFRICLAMMVALVEVVCAFVLGSTYAKHQLTYGSFNDHTSNLYKIFSHFNIPLVVFGIATTSLLIPLEDYVPDYEEIEDQNLKNSYDNRTYEALRSTV